MKTYSGRNLDLIAYPMGGIGAGMVCLQGTGRLGNVSVRNKPDYHNDPYVYSAVTVLGEDLGCIGEQGPQDPTSPLCRVVEAPVPDPNFFLRLKDSGNGLFGANLGLPRFTEGAFSDRFPFATVRLTDAKLPLRADIVGWSPFVPGDEDASSLPVAALEYTFTNTSDHPLDAVYYFCAFNFMKIDDSARVRPIADGFVLEQPAIKDNPAAKGAFCASVDDTAFVDTAWFRGGWFDTQTMLWNAVSTGSYGHKRHGSGGPASPGASLAVPFQLQPGASRTIRLRLSWFVGASDLRTGPQDDACCDEGCACHKEPQTYRPWYASRYGSVDEEDADWRERYDVLRADTRRFTDCFYDTTLPEDIVDAVAANLCILKSPTVLRQHDGRLWGWEGCCDGVGCCNGSCTHVYNYAQALCHLFPRLERSLRDTEFNISQAESGHQNFRSALPIRQTDHDFHAASDGQLGGVMKVYRDWRISGDTAWLKALWPRVRASLEYCIELWDPDHEGVVRQPHHNTYDIEFWGPDGMCSSFYLGALRAAGEMAAALGEDLPLYGQLYERGRAYLESELFNGEYFYQKVQWHGLRAELDLTGANPETLALLKAEGPKYQYGSGCLSDGILGAWLAELVGLGDILDGEKISENLRSIFRYNFKADLSGHANPQRPGYAAKHDAGLLLCSWPHGGKPSLPFVYSDEVWTGIEYQVASHLLLKGMAEPALAIVRGLRARYDGTVRNPYNEYECGHWYARAMASYALLQGYTGIRYDAVDGTLYVSRRCPEGARAFLSAAGGFGTVTVAGGQATVDMAKGTLEIKELVWTD